MSRRGFDWTERAWAFFAATSALYFLADNEADNDLWVHLFLGRRLLGGAGLPRVDDLSYTAAGQPWVDHEWLSQVGLAAIYESAGATWLWLFKLLLALVGAGLLWRSTASVTRRTWVRGAVIALVVAAAARGFAVRPQIFSYCAVAALLSWLDWLAVRRRGSALAPLAIVFAVFVLWANLHGAFIVGLGILGLFAVLPLPGGPRWRWAMPAVAVAAACVTPYGPWLFTYIVGELGVPHPLSEWQAVHPFDPAQRPFVLLFVAVAATLPFARWLGGAPWRAALLAITAFLAFRHQRHVPLFAICAARPLADQVDAAWQRLSSRAAFRLSRPARALLAVGLLAVAVAQMGLLGRRLLADPGGIAFVAEDYPVGAVRFAAARGLSGNLALPLDWGGYVLWHLAPDVKVSMDGRFATVYPAHVVATNFDYFADIPGDEGARLLTEYPTQYVLAPTGWSLPRRDTLHPLYVDDVATLYSVHPAAAAQRQRAPRGRVAFP